MAEIELWLQPWSELGEEGRDYSGRHADLAQFARGHAGQLRVCTDRPGGPVVDGRRSIGKEIQQLRDGRRVYAMPMPLVASKGVTVDVGGGGIRLIFDKLPDRPDDRLTPTTDRQHEAIALLGRVKSVWARMREVESAIADPATIWARLTELWLADDPAANPEMDVIVQQARFLLPTLEQLDRAPRRVLRRTLQMIPLSRVQEVDRRGMMWLVRQPGETTAERAGGRQRIRAVAREENFNTLENRVLRSYALLAETLSREYLSKYKRAAGARRVAVVRQFGKRCRQLELDLAERAVGEANTDATPNFVLQNNTNYRRVWDAWRDLLNRKRILDQLWRWQARSWEEFSALALVVAVQSIPGARAIATSPLIFQEEQEQGCWLRHVNPLAVFFLPEQDVTVEITYRGSRGQILQRFGAPIWLRFGRIGNTAFLLRWAVWPIWHAIGGLQSADLPAIRPLLQAGATESVRGGITIRPVIPDADAQSEHSHNAGCVTIGASGSALRDGIARLRDLVVSTVLRGAT